MSEASRLRGDEGYEVCDAVVTLRALRDAVRRELLRGLLLGPSALCCSLSAQALLPLLTTAQRFCIVTLGLGA